MPASNRILRLAAVTLACLLPAALAAQQSNPRSKKWVPTRPITVDAQSGALRLPTQAETAELVDRLATMTSQSSDGLAEVALPNGATRLNLDGRFEGVVLARPNADGTSEIRCVMTFEEAAEFLGLVEDASQPQ